jgi:hypothetical protein
MPRRSRQAIAFVGAGAALLLLPATASAGAAPSRDVAPSAYGGGGEVQVDNNETAPDRFDERHIGVGALAIVRPWLSPEDPSHLGSGGFVMFGATGELRLHRVISCMFLCEPPFGDGWHREAHFGFRLGIGYDFDWIGVRGGVLYADSVSAWIADLLVSPDLELRFGPRDQMWVEVGVGAYDASTTLRPGVYAAFSFIPVKKLTLSLHYGAHAGKGTLDRTVPQIGARIDARVMYELTRDVSLGLGVSHQESSGFTFDEGMWEGRIEARFRF